MAVGEAAKFKNFKDLRMKAKTILILMSFAVITLLAVNAQARSHKIGMKVTGCLQKGADSNTYVLNNITKGYTRRNTTGQAPLMLARSEGFAFTAKGDVDDLENHVGERVTVTGWVPAAHGYSETAYNGSPCSGAVETAPATATGISEFTVSKVHKKSGDCTACP
jgi:hypothetical protein